MKPQHTPGPWRIEDGNSIVAEWETGETVQIAVLSTTHWSNPDKRNDRMRQETKANGPLIVAVTDLLQACKDLEQIASLINARQHSGRLINTEDWCELYDRCNQAKSAIAKAEGKE